MKTIKSILTFAPLLLSVFFCVGSSFAAPQAGKETKPIAPEQLVANLYKQHKKRSPFFQTRSRALLDRYFDRNLANLIWKDARNAKGEVGAIDGDPLFNAQDMDIKNFSIHKPTFGNGQAEVVVVFENFDKQQQIVFVLVRQRGAWRIANLKFDDGTDLLGILKGDSAATPTTREVKVYLVLLGDGGKAGKKIGCDDSLVPVTRTVKFAGTSLNAALQELLSIPPEFGENPKLQNFWKGRDLQLSSVSIRQHEATIHISGEVFVAGICDEPRIVMQIEETARQFPDVKKVKVFIGKRTLAAAIR